jgi:DNA adenine methylase
MAFPQTYRTPFSYYGGKYSNLHWLLPRLPQTEAYVEPFGGSAAVLLNRQKSKLEIYNDADCELVNFFEIMRSQSEELIRLIRLTPYAREEFKRALNFDGDDKLERARKLFVRLRQGFGSLNSLDHPKPQWTAVKSQSDIDRDLAFFVKRLRDVRFENRDAVRILKQYDSSDALFYCDPPYFATDQAYQHRYTEEMYRGFLDQAMCMKAKVAISGYADGKVDKLLSGWNRVDVTVRCKVKNYETPSANQGRVEVLWTNYRLRRLF